MKSFLSLAACGLAATLACGCSLINLSDYRWPTDSELAIEPAGDSGTPVTAKLKDSPAADAKVANPPAKTIRFDGREIVLGTAEVTQLAAGQFAVDLTALLEAEKFYSATQLVGKNPGVAEQVIWERYAGPADDRLVAFTAGVLSRDVAATISWDGLLAHIKSHPTDGQAYGRERSSYLEKLKTGEPTDGDSDQLRLAAQRLKHPLVMADSLRLIALRELVAGRHAWAQSLFLQGAELAETHGDRGRAAELWMMAATTASRAAQTAEAQAAWLKAVQRQAELQTASSGPLNVHFWTRADEQRPLAMRWPPQVAEALLPVCEPVGCRVTAASPVELVLWCAVAASQYQDAQPQVALVSFKKAERLAAGDDVLWLRIAQSKCLAALGQAQAAAALLSGPAASENKTVAMASTAAIGSSKLRAGAYHQGAQLLAKALSESVEPNWPTRREAEADFALAQLIIGDTDQGLKALHAAQAKFQSQRDYVALLQSLENELRILELEERTEDAQAVRDRIREIERG